jgi:hypothetical protein
MTLWDEYFARYQDLPAWSPEVDDVYDDNQRTALEERLAADFSVHYPPSTQEDVAWFVRALGDDQRKYFVAFVLQEPRKVPEVLYQPMMRAAIREPDPSKDRVFVEPCMETFGLRRVNETLLAWFETLSDREKAGAVQVMYHAGLINIRESDRNRPDADLVFGRLGDLWIRQRCLLLQEFVKNPSVAVRQRIIPHVDLKNAGSYPQELVHLCRKPFKLPGIIRMLTSATVWKSS